MRRLPFGASAYKSPRRQPSLSNTSSGLYDRIHSSSCFRCSGFVRTSSSGTWCARQVPSTGLPSTNFGPVQPFGVRITSIGHIGRVASFLSRAFFWIVRTSATISSITAAMPLCMVIGSSPSRKYGLYPYPLNRLSNSSWLIRASTVGFAILKPFRCRIGSTAKTCLNARKWPASPSLPRRRLPRTPPVDPGCRRPRHTREPANSQARRLH